MTEYSLLGTDPRHIIAYLAALVGFVAIGVFLYLHLTEKSRAARKDSMKRAVKREERRRKRQ